MIDAAVDAVDLCAGPGGWDLAARELGIRTLGVELEGRVCASREAAGLAVLQGDVMLLEPRIVASGVRGLIGSTPCPTYSRGAAAPALAHLPVIRDVIDKLGQGIDARHLAHVGDTRDLLVVEPLRWALELEPDWIALEQVPAALPAWYRTAIVLESRGYATWVGILNASNYGVPQDRERAVLMARRGRGTLSEPPPLAPVTPVDVLPWAPDDLVGFPRRADRGQAVELNGTRYRARDLRRADRPTFTLTSKSRSWSRITADGQTHRLELDEAAVLQGFPPAFPFVGSRSAAFEQLANTVPPPMARAILETVTATAQELAA